MHVLTLGSCRVQEESLGMCERRHRLDLAPGQVSAGLCQLPSMVGGLPPLAASNLLLAQTALENSQVSLSSTLYYRGI